MSPKPATRPISLEGHSLGIAGHYLWEKEVLCDYLATRLGHIEEAILEDAKFDGITHEDHYRELCQIAKALRKSPGTGLHSKIELAGVFYDIRDFVQWDKEELADYMVHQIVALDLRAVFENNQGDKRIADDISSIAFAVYMAKPGDGCADAELEAMQLKKFDRQNRAYQMKGEEADAQRVAESAQKAEPVPAAKPVRVKKATVAA